MYASIEPTDYIMYIWSMVRDYFESRDYELQENK